MKIDKIAQNIAEYPFMEWGSLQRLLNNIELETLERNLINTCFLAGMFQDKEFQEDEVQQTLKNNFGLTDDSIQWCYQLVIAILRYRKKLSKKKVTAIQESVNFKSYPMDTNLPKSIIVRIDKDEDRFGIKDINCTIRKITSYTTGLGEVKLFCEITHKKITKKVLLYVIVYNDKGEAIEFNGETILTTKSGSEVINLTLRFPIDESISAIYLKPALDPADI
ncbi:hypothetical protein [Limosilactobacillus ingluviei]|uniref:hypothetical protein n=1 Tax=Limosilactobacillus ingluviei TaxID=148604 RepID=UPI0005946EA0|nr:hypothetical protein [Limosilactobacillus ingluviei]